LVYLYSTIPLEFRSVTLNCVLCTYTAHAALSRAGLCGAF
jgi:hypothetical protein